VKRPSPCKAELNNAQQKACKKGASGATRPPSESFQSGTKRSRGWARVETREINNPSARLNQGVRLKGGATETIERLPRTNQGGRD